MTYKNINNKTNPKDTTAAVSPPQNNRETSSPDPNEDVGLRQTITRNVSHVSVAGTNKNTLLFKKGMKKNEIKINLFLCEEEYGFEEFPVRRKINYVAKLSDNAIKEWYYTLGGNGSLQTVWEDFKETLISFCTSTGIEDLKKYKEEKWSSYLTRLRDLGIQKNIKEETILKKLRKEKYPQEVQVIVFIFNVSLKDMTERIYAWERLGVSNTEVIKSAEKKETTDVKKIKCFLCKEFGHTKKECPKKGKNVGLVSGKARLSNIKDEIVELNGSKFYSIFDSGSSINILSSKVVKSLGIEVRKMVKPLTIFMLDNQKIYFKEYIWVNFRYKGYTGEEKFYVIENPVVNVIIGNELIEKFKRNGFLIVCPIMTPDNRIISWTRPVFNRNKAEGFQKLVDGLLAKGYLENSSSLWCHPVVVVEKKDKTYRFTLDLTRLNDLVELDEFSLPKIGEITRSLSDARYFSILDLNP